MRIEKEKTILEGHFVDSLAGEFKQMTLTKETVYENYSIKRLNMKIWDEAESWSLENICNSSKDIQIWNVFKTMLDAENSFSGSQKELAKELDVSTVKINNFFKKMKDIGLVVSEKRGVYKFNPFVRMSMKIKSNLERERIQKEWAEKYGTPTAQSINDNKTLIN